MKKKNVSPNQGDMIVQFKRSDAQRIASVVQESESSRRGRSPSKLPRASGGGGVIAATFCGAWPKGQVKQITFSTDTAATANAVNALCSIQPVNTGDNYFRLCYVIPNSGGGSAEFALLNAEC